MSIFTKADVLDCTSPFTIDVKLELILLKLDICFKIRSKYQ